jgi:Flp pilus assembly pilin Flp
MKHALLRVWVKTQILVDSVREEKGQDLVEYALLGALISVVSIAAITNVGQKVLGIFNAIDGGL